MARGGDHTSGAKLGAAYIEATVKVKDAKEGVQASLEEALPQARASGEKLGAALHDGMLGYRPSQSALDAWANQLDDAHMTAVNRAFSGSGGYAITGDTVARGIADGSIKSFESGEAGQTVLAGADTFLGRFSEGIRSGVDEAGAGAANSFRGSFLLGIADGLQGVGAGTSLKEAFHSAFQHADLEGEGTQASEGMLKGFGDRFRTGFVGLLGGAEADGALRHWVDGLRQSSEEGGNAVERGLASKFESVKKNANDTSKAMEGVDLEGGEIAAKFGGLAEAAGLLMNPYVAGGAVILGMVAGLGLVMDKLDDLGEKWEETFDAIEIKTGATGPALDALEGQVSKIAGSVTQPIDQVGSTVADVSSLFNQTGDDVGKVSEEFLRAQKILGNFDLRTLAESFDAFGIKNADDQITAVTDIAHGYEAARIPVDEMSGALARLAPVSNQLGLNFHDTAGIITEFEKSGINSQRTVLTLTTGLKSLQDTKIDKFLSGEGIKVDKDNLNGSLNTVLETLKQLEATGNSADLSKARDIAFKTFGQGQRGGGAAALQALSPGVGQLDPNNFTKPIDGIKTSVDELYERTKHAGGAWEEFKNQVQVALEPLSLDIHKFIDEGLQGIIGFLEAHQHEIAEFFSTAADAAIRAGQVIAVAMAVGVGGTGLLVHGIGLIIDAVSNIVGAWADAEELLPTWLGGGKDTADGARNTARDIRNVGDSLDGFGNTLTGFSNGVIEFAVGPMGQLASQAQHAGDNIHDVTNPALQELQTKIDGLNGTKPPDIVPKVDTKPAEDQMNSFLDQYQQFFQVTGQNAANPGAPVQLPTGSIPAPPPGGWKDIILPPQVTAGLPGHQDGGGVEVWGAGHSKGKDSVLAHLAPGEHVWTDSEVDAVGGHGAMYHLRAMAKAGLLKGFDQGGGVSFDHTLPPGTPHTFNPSSWGHLGSGVGAANSWKDINQPPGGGNFNPAMVIDTSTTTSSGPGVKFDQNRLLFGDIVDPQSDGPAYTKRGDANWPESHAGAPQQDWDPGKIPGFQDGGAVDGTGVDVGIAHALSGTPYSKGDRADCSGMVGRIVEGATGTGGGLPTTKNLGTWLAARGFKPGIGPEGTISVGWYDHGPGENDGHAAMTLSDGENAESGPANKLVVGANAAGASSSEFDQHMYLPQLWGEGQAGYGGVSQSNTPSTASVQAANDKVVSAQGSADVAGMKLQEAQEAPLSTTKDGKLTKGAQAEHDKRVQDAQEAKDKADRDLQTAKGDQANLLDGSRDPAKVTAAQNALADAKGRVVDAQTKLDSVLSDPKHRPSDEAAAQNRLSEATTKVGEAQENLTKVQAEAEAAKPSKKQEATDPVAALGKIGGDVLKDNLPPGFSDPTSWPLMKDAGTLLKFIGQIPGVAKNKTASELLTAGGDAFSGDGGGAASSLAGLIPALKIPSPGGEPGVPPPAAGSGGGDTNIDASTTVHGDVGGLDAARKVVSDSQSNGTRETRKHLHGSGLARPQG